MLGPEVFEQRREAFVDAMGKGVAVFGSATEFLRNGDVEHEYRQSSDFFYLTGFREPQSVLVLSTVHPEHRMALFVRPSDPERETWDGRRAGIAGAVARFGADVAYDIAKLDSILPTYLEGADKLYYHLENGSGFDARILGCLAQARKNDRKKGKGTPTQIIDSDTILHQSRLLKTSDEVAIMRRAASISVEAHKAAMQRAAPGIYEFEVEAELLRVFRENGSERPAYMPIVGSAENATILHYRENNRKMADGDLLLIDAGCEFEYYAADITRTFPVNGRFTAAQAAIYDIVLDAQKKAIAACEPGALFNRPHEVATQVITEGLLGLGLLDGDSKKLVADEAYKKFYMHSTSHWLGMDVHDVGAAFINGKSRPLEPGMVLTVEPGIYIAEDADVDARYRGIGIRIEDDILITATGNENLTEGAPRERAEVEACVQSAAHRPTN